MRNSASARHISATPSWLDKEYSWIKPSTPLERVFVLSLATRLLASVRMRFASSAFTVASLSSGGTHSGSGARYAAVMALLSGVCGAAPQRNAAKMWAASVMSASQKPVHLARRREAVGRSYSRERRFAYVVK